MGLDPDELARIPEAERHPSALVGRFRITRRMRDALPFLIGAALAPVLWGLGAPEAAFALAAVVVVGWVVRSARRVAVFEIDEDGRLSFGRRGAVDWADVEEVSYRLRYPFGTPKRRRDGAVPTAIVRIERRGRTPLRLAQGQLFRTRPSRQHVSLHRLSDHLRRQTRSVGLEVERTGDELSSGWRATRSIRP